MFDFISARPRPGHVCRLFEDHPEGVFSDLSAEEYHAGPCIGSTEVKSIVSKDRTPLHFYYDEVLGYRKLKEPYHFIEGRAYHCLIEDPSQDLFKKEFAVMPARVMRDGKEMKCDGTTREGKAFNAQAAADGKAVLKEVDYKRLVDQVNVLYEHRLVRELLEHPKRLLESSTYKRHETGLIVRCRTDLQIPDEVVVDWKGVINAGPIGFGKAAGDLGYHVQEALYLDVTGAPNFVFIAQEKGVPYPCAAYELPPDARARGIQAYRAGMTLIAQCYESGEWPGYSGGVLDVPMWSMR